MKNYCENIGKFVTEDKSKAEKAWFAVNPEDISTPDRIEVLKKFINGSMGIVKHLELVGFNFANLECSGVELGETMNLDLTMPSVSKNSDKIMIKNLKNEDSEFDILKDFDVAMN